MLTPGGGVLTPGGQGSADGATLQAADRMFYIYQTLCDCQQALEGQAEPSPTDGHVRDGSRRGLRV